MRCFTALLLATTAVADWRLLEDDDSAIQLLQLKAKVTAEEQKEAQPPPSRDNWKPDLTEAQSLQDAECDIWGGTTMYKTFRAFTYPWNRGYVQLKNPTGGDKLVDLKRQGLYSLATSKDGRFRSQVFTTGWSSISYIHAVAFEVDGTAIRVLGPEPRPLMDTDKAYREANGPSGDSPYFHDPDAILGVWANHKMRIKIGDKMYSQFDLPLTVPGTNIEITQHSWNMNANVRLQSGLIIDNKDGFRAVVEQISSNADTFWMNINLKFKPDNVPEAWADDFCGRGNDANPMCGDAQGEPQCGPDGSGDWASPLSLFTSEDHEQVCYAANRKWGNSADGTCLLPGKTPMESYNRCRSCSTLTSSNPNDCEQEGDESADARWQVVQAYAQERLVKGNGWGICSMPPKPPPEPTSEELCEKIQCDHARGEQLCLPVKTEGEGGGGMYKDCLMQYCAECQEEAAQEFIGELEDAFGDDEDGDAAAAVGDPHLTTNGGMKFDLKVSP